MTNGQSDPTLGLPAMTSMLAARLVGDERGFIAAARVACEASSPVEVIRALADQVTAFGLELYGPDGYRQAVTSSFDRLLLAGREAEFGGEGA